MSATTSAQQVDHLVIGAGFAGLAAAIKLDEAGETDFVVIEKDSDVGGTWHINTYPGAECDVPSQLYSYSFALNPDWSKVYSPQQEIWDYTRKVAEDSGTLDRFVFDTAVLDARWDADLQRWIVQTEGPDGTGSYAARTVISGSGGLSEPRTQHYVFAHVVLRQLAFERPLDLTFEQVISLAQVGGPGQRPLEHRYSHQRRAEEPPGPAHEPADHGHHDEQRARGEDGRADGVGEHPGLSVADDETATSLGLNEIGRVSLRTTQPLFVDEYRRNRSTGAFILVDEATNATVAAGMIL